MKMSRRYLIILSVFIFVLFTNVMKVNAVNTGFKTNQFTSEEKNIFISNINLLTIDEEPVKKTITCFDVNSDQLIAIGQNTSDRKTICIYSNEGVFQYGYTFNCSGDFGVEWDEENLNIYFVRSSVIVSVTPRGEVLDVLEIKNTIENNSYVNHFIHYTKRTIGDAEYFIGNDLGILNLFASSYSQMIVKDSTGIESVIYDVGSTQLTNIIVTIGFVCVFVFVAIAFVARQFIRTIRTG
ncbi:MAG: hypothetical protein J6A49_08025 [Clostridia bacterium]|nr:hypothetical protein [Clostridia bacterium]